MLEMCVRSGIEFIELLAYCSRAGIRPLYNLVPKHCCLPAEAGGSVGSLVHAAVNPTSMASFLLAEYSAHKDGYQKLIAIN